MATWLVCCDPCGSYSSSDIRVHNTGNRTPSPVNRLVLRQAYQRWPCGQVIRLPGTHFGSCTAAACASAHGDLQCLPAADAPASVLQRSSLNALEPWVQVSPSDARGGLTCRAGLTMAMSAALDKELVAAREPIPVRRADDSVSKGLDNAVNRTSLVRIRQKLSGPDCGTARCTRRTCP